MSGRATRRTENTSYPFVQAKFYGPELIPRLILWEVVHDMEAPEGPRTAENCAHDFATRSGPPASAHLCHDSDSTVRCVHDQDVAFAAPGANTAGRHHELCGYARQTPAEWMDVVSLDTMRNAAREVADGLHRYGNPPTYRDAAALRAGLPGWTTHAQVTLAWHRTTHTDPGPGFPLAWFGQLVTDFYHGNDHQGDDMSAEDSARLARIEAWIMPFQAAFDDVDRDVEDLHTELLSHDDDPATQDRLDMTRGLLNTSATLQAVQKEQAAQRALLTAIATQLGVPAEPPPAKG